MPGCQEKFPQVHVVEASAGTGKTYCLANRYISLLLDPCLNPQEIPLNSILAITFTNKAASEMKSRILEFLKIIALDSSHPSSIKAGLILDYLFKNYNFFQVQTIDSFINTILCGCAFKLGLSANFSTERNFRDFIVYSLDKLVDRANEDKLVLGLFKDYLKQYLFLENKPSWLPKKDILAKMIPLFSQNTRFAGEFLSSEFKFKDSAKLKQEIIKLLLELQNGLPQGTNKIFAKSLNELLAHNKDSFNIDTLSNFFKRESLPLNKGNVLPNGIKKLWDEITSKLKELCEGEAVSVYNCYLDIFNQVLVDLNEATRSQDILLLETLNKQAQELFKQHDLGLPELYWRLATRFKHFLLDEFQDTSKLQWQNIFPMIEEALAQDGSLFYVGDKKQAIYRFRGGEAALMSYLRGHFRGPNLIEEFLNTNYRSQKEIVEFNNLIFSPENLRRFLNQVNESQENEFKFEPDDWDKILEVFSNSQQNYTPQKGQGYCRVEFLEGNNKEDKEAVVKPKVLKILSELGQRYSPEKIALLVRRNEEVQLLTSWLLEAGIPVESERTLDIRQNSYIKELVSFLMFLHSPIDNLSFASFILGDIFSQNSGIELCRLEDFLFSQRGRSQSYLYREFRQSFPEAWDNSIEEFFKNAGFIPLYELTVSILAKFGCLKRFSEYQGFFMRFLELIKEQEEKNPSIGSFLEFFLEAEGEDLYVNSSLSKAVKIITIHKAKGLEFPAVVVPFLELNIKVEPDIIIPGDQGLKLLYIKKKYAEFSPHLMRIRKNEAVHTLIDELNSSYVAFTRAAEELYILVPGSQRGRKNLGQLLFPDSFLERGSKPGNLTSKSKTQTSTVNIPASEYKDWIVLLKDESMDEGILRFREKALQGDILHFILSFIGNLRNQPVSAVLPKAIEFAQAKFTGVKDFSWYQDKVFELVNNNELKKYFQALEGEVFTEKELVDNFGDTKRIDRLILTSAEAIIIDYKSSKDPQAGYFKQVSEYKEIIQGIYPRHKVKGILIYLDDLSWEEV